MKIYNYSNTTKEYIYESIADKDPLDEDNFLIPAHATIVPPLDYKEGFVGVWNDAKWEYIEDYRGVEIYDIDGNKSKVDYLGAIRNGFTVSYTFPEIERSISPISMRQCRLKLFKMGLLEVVEAEMAKNKTLLIEWEYATEINIDNPLVLMLSEKLELNEEERIKMFEEARLL
jgi:hypothetical protein